MEKLKKPCLKIAKHYCNEYRLTGIGCSVLSWTASATGVANICGGNLLTFSAADERTLTISRAKWGQLTPGMEIFIHTTAADPNGPRVGKIAALDEAAGTITLDADLDIPAEALTDIQNWVGAAPELTREEPAFVAGTHVFAVGKNSAAVGRNIATGADDSFIVGSDGEIPGTPDFNGAFAVAHNGKLPLLFKTGELVDDPETGEKKRTEAVSLEISGSVIAGEFLKSDGSPIGGPAVTVNGKTPDAAGNIKVSWGDIPDKPSEFTPTPHRHDASEIDNLPEAGGPGLPETASDGEIMIWRDSVDRGNNADTRLLLQPATSNNEIIDQAEGNAAPLTLNVGANVTVNEAGQMVFAATGSEETFLVIPKQQAAATLITGADDNEWCLDLVLTPDEYDGTMSLLQLGEGDEYTCNTEYSHFFLNSATGKFWHWNGDEPNTGLLAGETHLLTVEQWKDAGDPEAWEGGWKVSYYVDGTWIHTSGYRLSACKQNLRIGGINGRSPGYHGKIDAIRFRTAAPYRGKSFTPEARPWLPPAGSWQKADLAELVKTIIDEYPFPDPVTELPVVDATFGRCRYLGIPNAQLTFADPVWQLKSVKMLIRSIADDVTGTIVIVPVVDGVEKTELSVVVPVGATWATVEIPLAIETGELILKRDWTDERDTLKDAEGVAVTAVIRSIREIIGNV